MLIRIDSKYYDDHGEEVRKGIRNEETIGFVAVSIHVVGAEDGGVGVFTDIKLV